MHGSCVLIVCVFIGYCTLAKFGPCFLLDSAYHKDELQDMDITFQIQLEEK